MSDRTALLATGFGFIETPQWHEGRLWLTDWTNRQVLSLDGRGRSTVEAFVPGQPVGLAFDPDGTPLVTSSFDRKLLAIGPGTLRLVADLLPLAPEPLNDLVVDGEGRAYIGTYEHLPIYEMAEPPQVVGAALFGVTADGTPSIAAEGVRTANGMVITPDGGTLIVAETNGFCLTAFQVGPDGGLGERRCFADLGDRRPDGICLDAEGAVWVASISSSDFLRVADGGAILDRIEVPGRWAMACVLGGDDLRTLYCLTALTSREVFLAGRSVGSVETVRVDVPGLTPAA